MDEITKTLLQRNSEKEKLTGSNVISDFSFSDLVDIPDLQQLVNYYSELAGCAIAIIDVNGIILAASGWQKICTNFHRVHPETQNHCFESDCFIRQNLSTENPIEYKCKNGLWDVAYPIFIEGKHLVNIFFGQFFFDDEKLDLPYFERQAQKYGFDKTEYLNYLHEVPVISRKKATTLKYFNAALAKVITKTGYANLLLKKEKIEEHRLANEQIKESELKFRKLFEQVGVGVAQVELPSGKFLKTNAKFADMLGYSLDEMLQLTFQDLTHPDELQDNLQQVNRLFKKEITEFLMEKRYIRKNGTIRWAELTVSVMGETDEKHKTSIAVIQDITERKKAEQDLIESELKFRKLFEQAGVGVAQVEPSTGKFLKVNQKFADMLGYSIDELLRMTFHNITHPDHFKIDIQHQESLSTKQITELSKEKRYIRKDGTVIWAALTASSMKEIEDGNDYIIAIIQDITVRKNTEETLRKNEQRLKFHLDNSSMAVIEWDANFIMTKWSSEAERMFGWKKEEVIGKHVNSINIVYSEDIPRVNNTLERITNGKELTVVSTNRNNTKSGKVIECVWHNSTLTDENGRMISVMSLVQDITERKKSEQALSESELKFRKLFEQAGVGVAMVDSTSGQFVKINKKYADMLGYSVEEMMQLTYLDFTHPDDIKESHYYKTKFIHENNKGFSIDKRCIHKDGTIVWVRLTSTAMWEVEEGGKFHISVVEDITDTKKALADLAESEEKFKSVFHQSLIGLELYDMEGKLLDCNPACLSLFGIDSINEVIGFNFYNDPNLTEQQKSDIKEEKDVRFEIKFDFDLIKKLKLYNTNKSGQHYFSCLATPIKMQEKNKNGFLLHLYDITENKKAEQNLKEENERFQTTMNSIDSVVYVADFESHEILFVNKYVNDVFGEIIGKKCYSTLQGKSAPCDFCTNHILLDANGKPNPPYIWEFQNLITKKWYQCHDQAIQWINGNLVRFEIATDITINKENELALKQNEVKLHELNSTKDKFFSIIAHDLKNPFSVLLSSSELLDFHIEKNDITKIKAKAKSISKASKQGYSLLENLLEWAKSQTGTIKFELKNINLKSNVSACITEVEEQAIKKNIIITNNIPDDLILTADKNLLAVVFRNLITNAIKFTHKGGSITIKASIVNHLVEVAVIDTGIGIPKEHQHKLFRIDDHYSRMGTANETSSSLGLILCKEFIEKHNGKIWVESEVDKGSEFKFTIPRHQMIRKESFISEPTPSPQLNIEF